MRAVMFLFCALQTMFLGGACLAAEATPVAQDAAIEQRLNAISAELRCLVCQNESLAGSRADLALDLRREIRIRIARGDNDDAIRTFLLERYGDFILYRPRFTASTVLLWLGPALLLAAGLALLFLQLRRRAAASAAGDRADAELSESERAELARVFAAEGGVISEGNSTIAGGYTNRAGGYINRAGGDTNRSEGDSGRADIEGRKT